jgi:hypothetical protein
MSDRPRIGAKERAMMATFTDYGAHLPRLQIDRVLPAPGRLRAQHSRSADGGRKLPKQTFRQRAGSTTVEGFLPFEENAVDDGFAQRQTFAPVFRTV